MIDRDLEMFQLRQELAFLRLKLEKLAGPRQPVFLAKPSASGSWQEQTVTGSNIVNHKGGRSCSGSSNANRMLTPSDVFGVIEINDGGQYRYVRIGGASMFPVLVEKTGGSNGVGTTRATWTYTMRDVSSFATMGASTTLSPQKPRDPGPLTYQSGTSGYGVAFYSGSNTLLWDAGESLTLTSRTAVTGISLSGSNIVVTNELMTVIDATNTANTGLDTTEDCAA